MKIEMRYLTILFYTLGIVSASAQRKAYHPDHQELLQSYRNAAHLDSTASKKIYSSTVKARWEPQSKAFWYRNNLAGNTHEYLLVDVDKKTKSRAFDHGRLAEALGRATGKKVTAMALPVDNFVPANGGKEIFIHTTEQWFRWDIAANTCLPVNKADKEWATDEKPLQRRHSRWEHPENDSISPDRKWIAFTRGGNVFSRSVATKEEIQLTTDGNKERPYGALSWSPNSNYLIGYRIDYKEEKKVYYVLSSEPGTTRGQLRSHDYMQPGEDFSSYEMYVFNPQQKSTAKVQVEKIDFFGPPVLHWQKGKPDIFTFEKVERGHQRFRVIEVNTHTAKTRNILDEQTKTFIYEQRIYTHYLPDTHEIIWVSEKDGWRSIYLIDELTGKEKKRITRANWVVREIDSVDRKKREIWFRASGMNPAEDPYNIHYYRIGFDGKNLVSLTKATGNHSLAYAPDRRTFIDTWSQVNVPPTITLNSTADGKKLMDISQAEVSDFLATGIKFPEVFKAKGRDGVTDIWGIVCKPSHMDSTLSYPIIENIYAGPQDSFVPKNFMPYSEMQSLAELGFIVVQMDGMGTANRSKAFHDVCWKNLGDAGFEDRILWMKALGRKYGWADTSRIGVYGTSAGGQNAGAAVLFHPEFYKSAVAACGCHDNRIDKQWWNEQWMGYPVGPHYEAQSNITNASKLTGNLMLVVGEADTNVPPESTYRFADALIKANKNFELVTVPGLGHSDGGLFGKKKKRDFFVKTLLGVDAPDRNNNELNLTK
ncbi:prolyl oligopeptidase family serine peptidase [Pedobacter sp. AW31-3R]|uniref:S9 family peptidase n=1 Tax=Pedobacter sp. AW31-3R TaxID=3445781 RepID=UPI003F9F983A